MARSSGDCPKLPREVGQCGTRSLAKILRLSEGRPQTTGRIDEQLLVSISLVTKTITMSRFTLSLELPVTSSPCHSPFLSIQTPWSKSQTT
jgi:hypothetical protein